MSAFCEQELSALRTLLQREQSATRFAHTLGVEECACRMAELLAPEKKQMLRAAALLHDLTKEYDAECTKAVLAREGIVLRADEQATPAVWHAITAPHEIVRRFPAFADPELLSAVRWHTTGHAGMTVTEAILYLADVIERGRAYPACVSLRERFWSDGFDAMSNEQRRAHLCEVTLASLEGVRESLLVKGQCVCEDTLAAIADLKLRKTL